MIHAPQVFKTGEFVSMENVKRKTTKITSLEPNRSGPYKIMELTT